MPVNNLTVQSISNIAKQNGATLIAVSKTKPFSDIEEAYQLGIRDFGENKVQEMTTKFEMLPKDIRWHMIGHLQSNKVKYIVPFVHLIHSVDSLKIAEEIDKQSQKINKITDVLLEVFIASEETKFGWNAQELIETIKNQELNSLKNIRIRGLMGMASFTEDQTKIRNEFKTLKTLFDQLKATTFEHQSSFDTLSMGMSGDYEIALEEGSTMIRVGSKIFGDRVYS
jgi:hypothetical protein